MFIVLFITVPTVWLFLFNSFLFATLQAKILSFAQQLQEPIIRLAHTLMDQISYRVRAIIEFTHHSVQDSVHRTTRWTINIHILGAVIVLGLALHAGLQATPTNDCPALSNGTVPELKEFGGALIISACLLGIFQRDWPRRIRLLALLLLGVGLVATGYSTPAFTTADLGSLDPKAAPAIPSSGPQSAMASAHGSAALLGVISTLAADALLLAGLVFTQLTPHTSLALAARVTLALLFMVVLSSRLRTAWWAPDAYYFGMLIFAYWATGVIAALAKSRWSLLGACSLSLGVFLLNPHFRAVVGTGLRVWYLDELLNRPWVFVWRMFFVVTEWMIRFAGYKALTWALGEESADGWVVFLGGIRGGVGKTWTRTGDMARFIWGLS